MDRADLGTLLPVHRADDAPDGLRVISEKIETVRSVAVGVWVGVGARDERRPRPASRTSSSTCSSRARAHDPVAIAQVFDSFGSELNAPTRESTHVHMRVLDNHLPPALDVMCDMAPRPVGAELESEREVVLEEIAMYQDDPSELVHDLSAGRLRRPRARQPRDRHRGGAASRTPRSRRSTRALRPRNRRLGRGQRRARAFPELVAARLELRAARGPAHDADASTARQVFLERETEQTTSACGRPACRATTRGASRSRCSTRARRGASSRLFQEIRERRGMAYRVYSYASHYAETGQVGIYLGTRAENVVECVEMARAQIAELAAGGLSAEELERARESLKGRMLLAIERPRRACRGSAAASSAARDPVARRSPPRRRGRARAVADLGRALRARALLAAGIGPDTSASARR